MNILLCCIAKTENQYIREFIEYYKTLGVSHICIFDNNDKDGERFESVIQDYIDDGFVTVIDYRGKKVCQLLAYQDCWDRYRREYDWIMFFDCDEFLEIIDGNLHDYLESFPDADVIKVNWKIYGDNNLVVNDGRPVRERFTEALPPDIHIHYRNIPENDHIKSIIRTRTDIVWNRARNPHVPLIRNTAKVYRSDGTVSKVPASPWEPCDYSRAILHHYTTKTAEEWRDKMKRGYPDQSDCSLTLNISKFFKYNEITEEKKKVFESLY